MRNVTWLIALLAGVSCQTSRETTVHAVDCHFEYRGSDCDGFDGGACALTIGESFKYAPVTSGFIKSVILNKDGVKSQKMTQSLPSGLSLNETNGVISGTQESDFAESLVGIIVTCGGGGTIHTHVGFYQKK